MELTTQYSSWYLILCVLLAGVYTVALYYKNAQNKELSGGVVQVVSVLRFLAVFIIAALLLNPLMQNWITNSVPPVIIVAQDNSASIINNKDSSYFKSTYISELDALKNELSEQYDVVSLAFGDDVHEQDTAYDFKEKRSNFSAVFDFIESRFAGDNIAAVILASDGLNNAGVNPNYYTFKQTYPVYTVALGDTALKSDLAIADIRLNDIVYSGNSFPIEVTVTSDLLPNTMAYLQVLHQGKVIEKRPIQITKDHQLFTEQFVFKAEEEGTQRYVFSLTQYPTELNHINNTQQALIDVVGNSDKILILAGAPHPDIAALKGVLAEKENYHIDVNTASEFTGNIEEYNLIIAHGFPTNSHADLTDRIIRSESPVWYILPGKTNLQLVANQNPGFLVTASSKKVNRILPVLNAQFNAFKLTDEAQKFVKSVPPLETPFADITNYKESQAFLFQKLGNVVTTFPLVYFENQDHKKTAWMFGEGIWRWKLYDYQENTTHEHFNEVIWKMVQYLSVKEDKSRFRVKVAKRFNENQNVNFFAEFYNKSYEQMNDLGVTLALNDEEENTYNYVFTPSTNGYTLDIGKLKSGVYTYTAKVNDGAADYTKSGSFIVTPLNIEWTKTSADFTVLQKLSNRTGGQFFLPAQMNDLAAVFADKTQFPAITYSSEKKQELVHYKWIFIVIVSLLTLEWVMRKYLGRY